MIIHTKYPLVQMSEFLAQHQEYVSDLEPRMYSKLSVRLYGRGVVLDEPADGTSVKMKRHQLARPGQVILSEIWAKKGAIGIVPPEGDGALITSHFFLFDLDETRVLRSYVGWLLAANYFEAVLSDKARGTTGYAAVRPHQFLSCTIPLPPLAEQRRIVARIDELLARVQEARRLSALASREADVMVGQVSGRLFKTLAEADRNCPLGDTFEIRSDLIRPEDGRAGQLCFVGLQHVESNTGRRMGQELLLAEELDGRKFRFSPGEILYGYLRPYLNKVWVADCEGVCSVDQYVIRVKASLALVHYVAHFMRSSDFLAQAVNLTHDLFLPRLRTALLKDIAIPLPPTAEQHRIVAYLDAVQAQVAEVQRLQAGTAAELDQLEQSILAQAFRGEL